MFDETSEKERVEESTEEHGPRILEVEAADRGEKPNSCRYCAGSKFC